MYFWGILISKKRIRIRSFSDHLQKKDLDRILFGSPLKKGSGSDPFRITSKKRIWIKILFGSPLKKGSGSRITDQRIRIRIMIRDPDQDPWTGLLRGQKPNKNHNYIWSHLFYFWYGDLALDLWGWGWVHNVQDLHLGWSIAKNANCRCKPNLSILVTAKYKSTRKWCYLCTLVTFGSVK